MSAAADARAIAVEALREAADLANGTEYPAETVHWLQELAATVATRPTVHVVAFYQVGFTIVHPLVGCHPDLLNCPAGQAQNVDFGPNRPTDGRFELIVGERGDLTIGERWQP